MQIKDAGSLRIAGTALIVALLLTTNCGEEQSPGDVDRLPLSPDADRFDMTVFLDEDTVAWGDELITLGGGRLRLLPRDGEELELNWRDTGSAGFRLTTREPLDLTGFREEGAISMEISLDTFSLSGLSVGVSCGDGCLRSFSLNSYLYDLADQVSERHIDVPDWHRISVPLSCFVREADDLSEVSVPLLLRAGGEGAIRVRNMSWDRQAGTSIDCPHYSKAAVTPAPLQEHWSRSWWMDRYRQKLEESGRESARLVFLGNSITQGWEDQGREVWEEYYADRNALNLGFSGDRTENVLWRLQHRHVDGLDPELVVLMVGTNNTGHRRDPPGSTAHGIEMIVEELKTRLPESRILLLAIFPRGYDPDHEMRQLNNEVNKRISGFADRDRVYYMDINEVFLDEEGQLPEEIMPDYLHPNGQGYRLWAEAMEPMMRQLLQEDEQIR